MGHNKFQFDAKTKAHTCSTSGSAIRISLASVKTLETQITDSQGGFQFCLLTAYFFDSGRVLFFVFHVGSAAAATIFPQTCV